MAIDIGLRILQVLDSIGIKGGSYLGKASNVKKAMFGGKSTMFKPNALQALRGEGKNFDDALKLIEEEAQYVVNASDAEKMAFLNNLNDYKDLGGPPKTKSGITALDQAKNLTDEAGDLQTSMDDLMSTAKTMKEDAERGLKSAEDDLKIFLETGGNPLKKQDKKFLGGSMHEEGQIRTGIRQFLQKELQNGRIKLDETDKFRVMKYSPMIEDDPILVFKKIYGDEAYKKAGTFPGAFDIGEDFNHYESIFRNKMGEDILTVKDKKYVGDGTLMLTDEVKTPTPDDDDMPFAEGGRAAFKTGKMVMGVQEIIKLLTKKMSPMGAMKELNKIIGKKGDYSRLTQKDVDEIVEATNDFVFQRDPDNLFVEGSLGKNVDDVNRAKDQKIAFEDSIKEMEGLGATQTAERFKLKQKYPGITDDLIDKIMIDDNPQRKAELLGTLDEAFRMLEKGKGEDEIIETFKNTSRTKNSTGGRAGFYAGGQSMIEPDLSDIGHGSDSLMSRNRILAPNSQATTSTGLNYLLGEDNDNTRIPFNEGLLVPPAKPYTEDMFEKDSMLLLKGMYGTGPESNPMFYNKIIEKGNILRNQGVERETVIEIIRKNKNKINAFLETQTTSPKTFKGLDEFEMKANGGRIGFQDGLNFEKALEKMLEQETKEDKKILNEGEEILKSKMSKFIPNETQKEKEEREMFAMVKEFQTLKKNGILRPDETFRNFQKMKTLTNLKNKILELNVKYPEKKIINEAGFVDKENLKSAIDAAEADLEISPIDGLTLKRSINTEGEQSVTSGSFDIGNLNFSSDNIEEGKLTSKGNYSFGDLDLSGMVNSNDGQILNTELGFNYNDALKGKVTDSDGYRSTELELDKTFPISDKFNLNLKGSADTQTFNGKTYRSSDLVPKLSYNDGIFDASISKEILEGGDNFSLNAGASFPLFEKTFTGDLILDANGRPTYNADGSLKRKSDYSTDMGVVTLKGTDLFTDNMGGTIGYKKNILDKDNLKFSIGGEMDPFSGEKTAGGYLKYNFADGGIAGLRQGYGGGGGVNLARRGFLKILGATAAGVAAFKSGALKLLGKTATTKAAPYQFFTAEAGSGAPAWFEGMVNKVLADGVDITKKAATMDGQTVKSLDTPTGKVDVTIDRMGNVDVNYQGSNTAMGEGVDMRYVVNQGDETSKGKPLDEFEAVESIPEGQMSSPNDYNVEFAENASDDVSRLYSDTSELAELGGQKPLIKDISTTIKKKQTLKKMNENPDQFASDNLRDDFPNYDYDDVDPNYD